MSPKFVCWLCFPATAERPAFAQGIFDRPSPESVAMLAEKGIRVSDTKEGITGHLNQFAGTTTGRTF